MNDAQREFIEIVDNQDADNILVVIAQRAMRAKLRQKRGEGRGGWWRKRVLTDSQLCSLLADHVKKGDMVDVMNIAAMIYLRQQLYDT